MPTCVVLEKTCPRADARTSNRRASRRTLLASENLNVTAAGTKTRIKVILTSAAIYLHEASLTSQLGKPWVKMDLSALAGTSGASLARLVHSLQDNNFTSQAQLFTVAKNTRVVGGGGNPAASLHFVRGYDVTYDSTSNSDRIVVFLFQFATPADAAAFKASSLSVAPGKPEADPLVPGAEYYDATSPSQGMYDHGVVASKGNFVYVIDDATSSASPVPLVETMARQQYAAL